MKNKIVLLLIFMCAFFVPNIKASSCEEGSYKVVYNANGGKGESSATCVSSTLSTIKPTRSGYKFLGWAKSKTATTVLYNAGEEVDLTEDTTLYAVWSKGYKITYNANGGSVSSKTKTVYKGLTYGTLQTPKRKGYKFLGWYTKASDGVNVTKETKVTKSKSHTLYAHWQKIKYTITYELNGGSNNSKNKTSYYVTTSKFKLNNPTKKGYRFLGWYTSSKYKTKVTYVNKGTTGNKKYYARWTPIKYDIKYYGNGQTSGSTKTQKSLKYNKTYTLNSNGFKKKDYVFDSWNTKKDGTGKKYTNKQSIKNLTSSNGKTIKLYARWKRREYTITYELNGGINPSNAYKKYTKVSNLTLKTPTREGYTFMGWYTSSSYKTKVTKISKGTTGNKVFYAKWNINRYSINYELNGGNLTNPTKNYTVEDNVELLTPIREGYAFKGWYTTANFDNQITEISKGTAGDLTLYAKWENLESYKITYELNGGINSSDVVTTYTNDQKIVLSNPTRDGYIFDGWYTENTFENKVESIEKGSSGDKTFYAKWSIANYNITYNLNGGSNPSDTITSYTINDNVTLPTPTKIGYTFDGWYTENTFENRAESIERGSHEDKIFYAKWTVINYTITYNLNGGTNPNNIETTYTIKDEVILPTPTREGFRFLGWYTESTFENRVDTIVKGTTENKIFYARWGVNEYLINYVLDGGQNTSDAPSTFTVNEEVLLPTPTKKGYIFIGWFRESTFVNKVTSIEKGSNEDQTFYAKWKVSVNYITYNLNGGSNPSNATLGFTVEDEVILPTPTKSGYGFVGWYTESTFINKINKIEKGTAKDITLYAKWEKLQNYTITYNLNGGSNPSNAATSYTINDEVILPTPTKNGYGFVGWYTESTFVNKVEKIEKGTRENIVLYAKWGTITNYKITYNLNGGINPSNAVTSYNAYEEVILPTPTKNGYVFRGWYTESTFINKIEKFEKGTTGNKTLYAKWQEGSLTRNYDYEFYNYEFDDKLTSLDDIKNTLFNIMNLGYEEYTVYCEYDNLQDCFDDYNKVVKDVDLMKSISDYINPYYNFQTFSASRWSSGKFELHITYSYSDDYQGVSNYKETINNKIDEIISKYNITNLSDEEKISVFHDYIVNNTVYDIVASETDPEENKSSFTAYGVLINGSAVCQGYADAMAIFLDRFGIPNLKVSSATHTWNLIYINGKWLHLDATWDDPVTSNGSQILLHDYYLVTTSELFNLDTSAHTFNQNLYLEAK